MNWVHRVFLILHLNWDIASEVLGREHQVWLGQH